MLVNGLWRMDPRARDVTSSTGNCIVDNTSFAWKHDFGMPAGTGPTQNTASGFLAPDSGGFASTATGMATAQTSEISTATTRRQTEALCRICLSGNIGLGPYTAVILSQ